MLINFTVGNYLSFKEKKTLSMKATPIKELRESLIIRDGYKLLPSAVIYGANSSGKSNFLKAIGEFKEIVKTSVKLNSTDKLKITPFLLNENKSQSPSFFEIELLLDGTVYRYGFEADANRIYNEWLFSTERRSKGEICLFFRTPEEIGITEDYPEGNGLEERTRDNGLFLSVVDSFNGKIAQTVMQGVRRLLVISGLNHEYLSGLANDFHKEIEGLTDGMSMILSKLDVGFTGFEIPDDKELANRVKAYTLHKMYDDEGQITGERRFTMKENESSGTNKLFDICVILYMALNVGGILAIDELDSKLHPLITRRLINLFNDREFNVGGGQLIFTTHDTNLLNIKTFRRDQIWFTEKDPTEATDLYSLVEFKEPDGSKIRNDRSFEKDYINGRYGAIPFIKS